MSDSDNDDKLEEFIEQGTSFLVPYTKGPFNTSLLRKFLRMFYEELCDADIKFPENSEIVDEGAGLVEGNENTSEDESDVNAIDGEEDY